MILTGGFFNAGKHCHTWNWFYSRLFKQGLHYLFSELRQPMVGNVCAIGKHPEKLASRTNILKDCVLCTDPIDSVLFKFHPTILIVAVPPSVSVDIAKPYFFPIIIRFVPPHSHCQICIPLLQHQMKTGMRIFSETTFLSLRFFQIFLLTFMELISQVSASIPYPQHLLLSTLTAVYCLTFCLPLMEKQFLYLHLRH